MVVCVVSESTWSAYAKAINSLLMYSVMTRIKVQYIGCQSKATGTKNSSELLFTRSTVFPKATPIVSQIDYLNKLKGYDFVTTRNFN